MGLKLGLALLVLAAAACHEFLPIEGDIRCGNRVVEPNNDEDCDGVSPAGTICGRTGPAACKLTCAPLSTGLCPNGWACGDDGICRQASARFGAPTTIDLIGSNIELGDLDADGYSDIVASETVDLTVRFGDPDGNFSSAAFHTTPPRNGATAIGELDGEPGEEVVVPVGNGVMVVPGSRDRAFTPHAFTAGTTPAMASGYRPIAVRAVAPYDRQVMAGIFQRNGAFDMEVVDAVTNSDAVRNALRNVTPRMQGTYGDHFAVADVDNNGGEEIALAVRTSPGQAGAIHVVAPRCTQQRMAPLQCTIAVRATVTLPTGYAISESGTFFADVDGDGDQDLLATVESNNGPREVAVSYGDGHGGFTVAVVDRAYSAAAACSMCPPLMAQGAGPLLAAGDLNGDGRADYVYTNGIMITRSRDPLVLTRTATIVMPLAEAIITRLDNGDAIPDVVGTSRQQNVSLYLNLGSGRFLQKDVETPEPASQLHVGDFNADTFLDLAYLEAGERVVVLHADGRGVPAERVVMADIGPTDQFESWIDGSGNDDISDLFAVSTGQVGPNAPAAPGRVYRFSGSSSNRMLAPINFGRPVYGALIGYIAERTSAPRQLLVYGGGPATLAFWVVRPEQLFAEVVPPLQPISGEGCSVVEARTLLAKVADLDGDGLDEVVTVTGRSPVVTNSTPVIIAATEDRVLCKALDPISGFGQPVDLHVADLDGDGARDVVVLFSRTVGPVGGDEGVAIWWGDAAASPPLARAGVKLEGVRHAAPIDIDGDGISELLVVDATGVAIKRVKSDKTLGDEVLRLSVNARPEDIRSVRKTDTNADGLEDLVIGSLTQVSILPRVACKPDDPDAPCGTGVAP